MKNRDQKTTRIAPPWTTIGLALLAVFVVLDVAWRATAPVARPSPGPSSTEGPELDRLQAEIDRLRDAVARLDRRPLRRAAEPVNPTAWVVRAEATRARSPEDSSPVESTVPSDPPEMTGPEASPTDGFERRLAEETVDEGWAEPRESELVEALGQGLGAAYLVDADCRHTLCRVELGHPDPSALDHLSLEVLTQPAMAGRRAHFELARDGGNGRLTVFVARRGHELAPSANDNGEPPG